MRLPFTSRRKADEAMCLLVEVTRRCMADVDEKIREERAARPEAEGLLAAERKLSNRAVAYVKQAEGRRDADGHRLARALRAVASGRAREAAYRRTITRLTVQLLDATGYPGEPLLPAAQALLGIDVKEDGE